jgi:hypothetical protein
MVSDHAWDTRTCFVLLATLSAALVATTTESVGVRADETEVYRHEFQNCSDDDSYPALDDVHHSQPGDSATFYYIADVEHCSGSRTYSIRHTVKNLHPRDSLPFLWEGTMSSHVGLLPGAACCDPVKWISYNGSPFASHIKYGVSLDYPVPVATYPLPQVAEVPEILKGDELISRIDTEYIDNNNQLKHVFVQLRSSYIGDNVILYNFKKEPDDLVLAVGGLPTTSVGDIIATSLSAEVAPLGKFVTTDNLSKIPIVFAKEQFLVIPAYSKEISNDIKVQMTPTKTAMVVPVAVLSKDFVPIVTNAATLLVP